MNGVGYKQARKRYFRLFWPAMAIYIALAIGGKFWLGQYAVEPMWLKITTSLAVSIPLVAALGLMLRYAFETDEFQRRIQIESMAIAGVLTASVASVVGFLQMYDVLPEFSVLWFGPGFMMLHGLASLFRGGRHCL